MYQLNPLYEILSESKPIQFTTGSLSASFNNLRKVKAPWSRISPQVQDQMDRAARKKAADAIRQFDGNPILKKREWVRQLRSTEAKIRKNLKAHGG